MLDLVKAVLTYRLIGIAIGTMLVLLGIWSLGHGAVLTGVVLLVGVAVCLVLLVAAFSSRARRR